MHLFQTKRIPNAVQPKGIRLFLTDDVMCGHACTFLFAVSRSKKKMAVEKRLAFSVVQFLRDQIHCAALNSDEQESLEGGSAPPASILHSYLNTSATVVCLFVSLPSSAPPCRHQWRYSVWRRPLRSVPATATSPPRSLSKRYSSTPC